MEETNELMVKIPDRLPLPELVAGLTVLLLILNNQF